MKPELVLVIDGLGVDLVFFPIDVIVGDGKKELGTVLVLHGVIQVESWENLEIFCVGVALDSKCCWREHVVFLMMVAFLVGFTFSSSSASASVMMTVGTSVSSRASFKEYGGDLLSSGGCAC